MWFWRLWHILFHESPRGHRCRGVHPFDQVSMPNLPEYLQATAAQVDSYDYGPRRITLGERLERLENIAVLLAEEAARGQGLMGKPFWEFIDAVRAERQSRA